MIWIILGVVIIVAGPVVARRFEKDGNSEAANFDPFRRRRNRAANDAPDRPTQERPAPPSRDLADPDKLPPVWRRRPR